MSPAAPQSIPFAARPGSLGDLFVDPGLEARLRAYLGRYECDLHAMRDDAASASLVRTPFVIAQSEVKPPFRGVIWDLRRRGADCRYSPLDAGRAVSSHLDLVWLGSALARLADAELLLHGSGDVSFKAEVPPAAVVSPHLLLLGAGYAGVAAQVGSFVESGLYTAHA